MTNNEKLQREFEIEGISVMIASELMTKYVKLVSKYHFTNKELNQVHDIVLNELKLYMSNKY
jgi:hypothetical protein